MNATGASANSNGGLGGWVQASLSVTAGQTLYIFVGGSDSYNGGGQTHNVQRKGGGATDIRTILGDLKSRLIVAGGGGANGWYSGAGGGGNSAFFAIANASNNRAVAILQCIDF